MTRPAVSVVMPFAGDEHAAREAFRALSSLDVAPGDELILVDNVGRVEFGDATASATAASRGPSPTVLVIRAVGERSPAHARNAGAGQARGEWILFLDADCRPRSDLLAAYFRTEPAPEVGALAGEVLPDPGARGIVGRYGAARSFLSQRAHLSHPFRPRAAAANLLVRREAFVALGGFFEGLRAAEDTDFSWRLQRAGWRLELRPEAWVTHRYRGSLRDLRRQWRGYAAGRAWLARRYEGFRPRPALVQVLHGHRRAVPEPPAEASAAPPPAAPPAASVPSSARLPIRVAFLALDALLAVEELVGFALSNRPSQPGRPGEPRGADRREEPGVILLAERFPPAEERSAEPTEQSAEPTEAIGGVHVHALHRAERAAPAITVPVEYLEDDGGAQRALALAWLLWRHPLRCLSDAICLRRCGREDHASLWQLAPAVRRLERHRSARVHTLGEAGWRAAATRIARLAGRRLEESTPPAQVAHRPAQAVPPRRRCQ